MKFRICLTIAAAFFLLLASSPSHAFMKEGCGGGECTECHSLTREEAADLLTGAVDNVLSVEPSPVGGLWVVDIEKGGKRWPVYIDFSKGFLISGQIIRLSSKENVTQSRYQRLNPVDVSSIPLENSIVIGDAKAKRRIIEFSDPDCHFCVKLHAEAKKVVAKNPDVAFFVKLYSRNNNPGTVRKIRSIMCGKQDAPKLLDAAFAGMPLPNPECKTSAVDDTARLAGKLNLRGTPAMILPDGRVVNGYRDAETILKLLEEKAPSAQKKK
jgi:thiol:disulfide interchange protein DsbC